MVRRSSGRYREIWGDVGRYWEITADRIAYGWQVFGMGRSGEILGDLGRCGAMTGLRPARRSSAWRRRASRHSWTRTTSSRAARRPCRATCTTSLQSWTGGCCCAARTTGPTRYSPQISPDLAISPPLIVQLVALSLAARPRPKSSLAPTRLLMNHSLGLGAQQRELRRHRGRLSPTHTVPEPIPYPHGT